MTLIMIFCFYMAAIYVPWDFLFKPVSEDQEVWFGILFTGWWAKATEPLHFAVYAAGAWGFLQMKTWMHPWAALYVLQIAVGMFIWNVLDESGSGLVGGLISALPFILLVAMLWRAKTASGQPAYRERRRVMNKQHKCCAMFRQLHETGAGWVIPNPWDAGSARILEGLGFKALATTSGGYAFTLGKQDGAVSLEEILQHCSALVAATSLPVNADFENGYADDIETMVANIKKLAATGVAGISIEDFSRDEQVIYPFAQAVERVQAAAQAIAATGIPIMLTARAEGLLRGVGDLEQIKERLQAYEQAGADVLYAPAIGSLTELKNVTANLHKPVNVLPTFIRDASVQELAQAGANRISVGGALTYAALAPLLNAGREMLEQGTFSWIDAIADGKQIKQLLGV